MQKSRKNPWLLAGAGLGVVAVGLVVFGLVIRHKNARSHEYLTNSIGMKLVLVPAGKFQMGSPRDEEGREEDEGPRHEVEITRPFYVGIYEVTQEQYRKVMGQNPSVFTRSDAAVENVSWDEAVEFCEKLSARPEEKAAGRVYRLPTEAEWEYACRAGTTGPFWFDESLDSHCWYADNTLARTKRRQPPAVGETGENPFGLSDTHGDVREWCRDWYGRDYYEVSPSQDPRGPKDGDFRAIRGGSRGDRASECRSAARLGLAPGIRLGNGFRVVLEQREGP